MADYNANLFRENKPPALTVLTETVAEVFITFDGVVQAIICACSSKSGFPVGLRSQLNCIDQQNFKFCAIEL